MAQRWGRDNEERSAVAQKAQDAYAAARQALAAVDGILSDMTRLREALEASEARETALGARVRLLERQFIAATEPAPRKATRKAA